MQSNEKYLPYFRKYRPQSFKEIVGQKALVKALTSAIETNRIANAYLFAGPRGTGKTSTARIFAKSLNCEKGMTISPCQTCASCIDITNATGLDVIEIDAASSRGIDDAKELISQVHYAPINGKYKIFIIDEVHMLTKEAFNTLLKTFEEPPSNVIFILATTEPNKVLETIVSRCQRYDFKRITVDDIYEKLEEVSKLEGIKITKEALYSIANFSNGGLRDSLALLDQVSVLGLSNEIKQSDIENLVGKISFKPLFGLTKNILDNNTEASIQSLEELLASGNEPRNLCENLISFLKNVSIVLSSTNNQFVKKITLMTDDDIKTIKNENNFNKNNINKILELVINFYRDIKSSINPYLWIELMIIEASNTLNKEVSIKKEENNFQDNIKIIKKEQKDNIQTNTAEIVEKHPETQEINGTKENIKPQNNIETMVETPSVNTSKNTITQEKPKIQNNSNNEDDINFIWSQIVSQIKSPFSNAFFKGVPLSVNLQNKILTIGFMNENVVSQANKKIDSLKEAVASVLSEDIEIVFSIETTGKKTIKFIETDAKPVQSHYIEPDNTPYLENPTQKKEKTKEEPKKENKDFYSEKTKMYLDEFNGKIID